MEVRPLTATVIRYSGKQGSGSTPCAWCAFWQGPLHHKLTGILFIGRSLGVGGLTSDGRAGNGRDFLFGGRGGRGGAEGGGGDLSAVRGGSGRIRLTSNNGESENG